MLPTLARALALATTIAIAVVVVAKKTIRMRNNNEAGFALLDRGQGIVSLGRILFATALYNEADD